MAEKRYVSSMEVARLAGVSQSAVSRTFTKGASVSSRTREKVLEAARKLGYRANLLPQALISNRSRLVAIAVGGLTNPFYAAVLEQFTAALQDAGQQVVLIQVEGDYVLDTVLDRAAGYRVDALVSALAILSPKIARALSTLRIPVVCVNGRMQAEWVSSVSSDNLHAGAAAADHLYSAGGRRFAFVGGSRDNPAPEDRRRGFVRRLRRLGQPAPLLLLADHSYEGGLAAAARLIADDERPNAVACANDLIAFGILDGLGRAGLRAPDDMLVLGYDNIGIATWVSYELTSFDQDVPRIVSRSLHLILDDEGGMGARRGVLESVPARLIVRRTTGAGPGER